GARNLLFPCANRTLPTSVRMKLFALAGPLHGHPAKKRLLTLARSRIKGARLGDWMDMGCPPDAGKPTKKRGDLDAERAAAAAGALHIGVVELEASALESLDVVDLNAVEVHGAHLIHGNLESVEVQDLVG